MELTHLYYFGVVLDAKNIVEASRLLNVSQSTLTGAIQKMEQELGVALFDRSGRKLIPTEAASVLREFSAEVFRNLEYMRSDIAASKEPPHMRVALASPSIMTKIPQFQQNCPDIPIAAQMRKEKDFLYYLNHDLFDLCITTEQLDYPDIASERLFTDYLWVSVTKDSPLAQYPMAHIRDLKDQTIILPNGAKQNALFSRFMELVKEQNVFVNYVTQGTTAACAELARRTNHLLILSSLDRNSWNLGKNRRIVLINPADNMQLVYYAAYRANRRPEQAEDFIDWIKHGCHFLRKRK